jgi:hypothetical protein
MVEWAGFTSDAYAPNESALLPPLASRMVGPQSCSELSGRIFFDRLDRRHKNLVRNNNNDVQSSYKTGRVVRRELRSYRREGGIVLYTSKE